MVITVAAAKANPNHTRPASWRRYQKNRWKNVNPTAARRNNMADAANTTLRACKVARSPLPTGSLATTCLGNRRAATNANAKKPAAYHSVAPGPMSVCNSPAGPTAARPTNPAMRLSFELASTSSLSLLTTDGTSALREMAYVFCKISATNASGNSNRLSTWLAISSDRGTRANATACTTNRRPPGARSMTGPMNGAMNRNGTRVIPRYSSTFVRAASGSRLNNTEPARATVVAASPATMAACVPASRRNFDTTGGLVTSPS